MKLSRDTALKIHYVLDQLVPPIIRDCPWIMVWPLKMAFGRHAPVYLNFRKNVYDLTEEQFRDLYAGVADVAFERPTDLNETSIRRLLEEVHGPRVLEVGCGRGYMVGRLVEKNYQVTACDIVLQEPVRAMEPAVTCFESNMEALPFADRSFDTVICTHTLEHVRNLPKAVAELRRVGKRLLVIVPRQRPYKYTFDLHLNFFPYPVSLLSAFGKTPGEAHCEDVDGDLLYIEDCSASAP